MKKLYVASLLFIFLFIFYYCTPASQPSVNEKVKSHLLAQLDSLNTQVEKGLLRLATEGTADSLRAAFKNSRVAYKKIEWFSEYYAPTASKELNGVPLPEIEIEETKTFPPSGFQVIEELLYPEFKEENRLELVREVKGILSTLKRERIILEDTEFTEAHIMDACKQEVFRNIILGISGFDTPLAKTGVQETAVSLKSIQNILALLGENNQLDNLFKSAIAYINNYEDFDSFNRMTFITRFANPITTEITSWQKELKIEPLKNSLALRPEAATLFEKEALNSNHFANSLEAQSTPEKIALGKTLFFNPVVSGNNRTCASCHKPELAFTDGLPQSTALTEGTFVKRNAPTLLYAGLQNAQFYDMRSPTLENQAMDVIANKDEMHASVEEATDRLNKLPVYVKQFKEAFPAMKETIRPRYVMIALASYVRSLAPFSSRFDEYMRGDYKQMNEEEIKGFNLFMGKAKCGSCHFMPLFNGTAGPNFTNTEAEVLGVPADRNFRKPILDPDQGRYLHNKIEELRYSFKTPTIRNIALTAPYMHNGAFNTLEDVIDFYDQGGGAGLGINLPNQTLPADKLNLTDSEKSAIIAFMKALSDTSIVATAPEKLLTVNGIDRKEEDD